jgi:hypothetical protein
LINPIRQVLNYILNQFLCNTKCTKVYTNFTLVTIWKRAFATLVTDSAAIPNINFYDVIASASEAIPAANGEIASPLRVRNDSVRIAAGLEQ